MPEFNGESRGLFANLPSTGNAVEVQAGTPPPAGGTPPPAQVPPVDPPTPTEDVVEPTAEEIQATLDELAAKSETELSDEDKEYIKKYVPEETDDEITSIKKEVETEFGLTLEGKYDNGPDGLKNLVKDLAPTVAKQIFTNAMAQIPHMKEFYEHVTSGRTIDTFLLKNSKPAFESIELKSTDDATDDDQRVKLVNNQKALIQLDLKSRGLSDDDIENLITLTEAKGGLYDKAKASLTSLKAIHTEKINAQLKAEEDRIEADRLEGI